MVEVMVEVVLEVEEVMVVVEVEVEEVEVVEEVEEKFLVFRGGQRDRDE